MIYKVVYVCEFTCWSMVTVVNKYNLFAKLDFLNDFHPVTLFDIFSDFKEL